MIPTDVLKNEIIKTSIKSITSSDVLIRERYDGVPIQPINSNILILCSYEVSTLNLIGSVNKDSAKPLNWKTCVVVAKGEYVNAINLGDNIYGNDIVTTGVFSKTNDYSTGNIRKQLETLKASERAEHTRNNPKTLIYEYFLIDSGYITGIILEDNEVDNTQLELELIHPNITLK